MPDALVGDPGRLRQVLINLVGNAVKFTDAGEVIVAVAVDHAAGDEVALQFAVSDTGIGIAPEQAAGRSSSRSTRPTRRRPAAIGGTGLGLAISTQLVELMGGRVWVESELGKGSQFHFVGAFGTPADGSAAERVRCRRPWHGVRVLVVDDNADEPPHPGGDAHHVGHAAVVRGPAPKGPWRRCGPPSTPAIRSSSS